MEKEWNTLNKLNCPQCGSGKIRIYEERIITEVRKINKDNTVSKRKERFPISSAGWSGIECLECRGMFDYDLDKNGKIIEIFKKD